MEKQPLNSTLGVLYISFKRPQQATHSEMLDEVGVLLNYRWEELVGMTIFEASKR